MPNFRNDVDMTAELVEIGLDDIHADTSAGDVGDLFGRRKTRQKDQVDLFLVRHHLGLFEGDAVPC